MGTPSFSIVAEELLRLGAKQLIRVGTCGGIAPGIRTGDMVLALSATPADGATRTYLHGDPLRANGELGADPRHLPRRRGGGDPRPRGVGGIGGRFLQRRSRLRHQVARPGVLAFEMEASGPVLSRRPGRRAGSLRADGIDVLSEQETTEETYLSPEDARRRGGTHDRSGAAGSVEERGNDRDHQPRGGEPGRRHHQSQRRGRGAGLPATEGHRPRRVLGRQRQAGGALLPRAVGLHPRCLRGAGDRGPRIGPAT